MRTVLIAPIRAYQKVDLADVPAALQVPPDVLPYAVDAIREFGVMRGVVLGGWRLLRCNPWSHGGVDYAHDQTVFRT